MTGLIDPFPGEHRVRAGADAVRGCRASRRFDALGGCAQLPAQGGEALGGAALVGAEPQIEHAQALAAPLLHGGHQ
ncbi:hypothetical protein A6V29_17030 [Blastococcus sp. CCUG 61487]|nr:hypothetical protein A6V29_17030 [Blastococcus sp. CCUG 61487]